ncbi:MAG: heparinase II/III-family protein [Pirellulales bacterium]|nr:heparinase II/III-family protein [Pirellulales bacterium]
MRIGKNRRAQISAVLVMATITVATQRGYAQLSIGSTTGVLPPSMPTTSLILGDDLNKLQAEWQSPVNATQQYWKSDIVGRANQAVSGAAPATFAAAATNSSIAEAAGLRFAMTGATADLNKTVTALLVAAIPAQNGNDFITHPEVLTTYLTAYDMIRGASLVDLPQTTRTAIESRLTTLTNNLSYGNNTYSNARSKIGATKALAGVVLRDQSMLDQGLTDLQGHFNYSTTDDGWFADSQGHYLNYTLRHLALFARAYDQGSGVNIYPNLQPLFDLSIGIRMPDGTTPNVSNGLNRPVAMNLFTQTPNAADAGEELWYHNSLPQPYPFDAVNILNNNGTYSSFFALTDFTTATPQAPTASPTYFAPGQSHISVFREDWGTTSDYLMISPGVDPPPLVLNAPTLPEPIYISAFHSHNDTMELLLAAKGKYLLVAPGYQRSDLSNSPPGLATQDPTWHNVVLIDGGVGPQSQGMRMRPEEFTSSNRLDSTELGGFHGVSDFSSTSANYASTDVTRSMAFPGEDYFVVVDRMQGDSSHAYGFNLVGRGTRTVLGNQPNAIDVKWEHDGAQVIEHLIGTQAMSLTTGDLWMHDTFNDFEPTKRMTATMSAEDGMFLSVLETGTAGAAAQLSITTLANTPDLLAVGIDNFAAGWHDTIVSQLVAAPHTTAGISTDAWYAYIRQSGGELTRAMLSDGTGLDVDGQQVVSLDHAATFSLLFDGMHVLGTISADGFTPGTELAFANRGAIATATLNGAAISFSNQPGSASVQLSGPGALDITFVSVPEPASAVLVGIAALILASCRRTKSGVARG